MTTNVTRKKTTKSGAPNYCNLYKDLQEEHVSLQKRNKALSKSFEKSLEENTRLERLNQSTRAKRDEYKLVMTALSSEIQVLKEDYAEDLKDAELSSKLWRGCSILLLCAMIAMAVMVGGMKL